MKRKKTAVFVTDQPYGSVAQWSVLTRYVIGPGIESSHGSSDQPYGSVAQWSVLTRYVIGPGIESC